MSGTVELGLGLAFKETCLSQKENVDETEARRGEAKGEMISCHEIWEEGYSIFPFSLL